MTLTTLLEGSIQNYGDKPALAHKPKGADYQDISYRTLGESVNAFCKGLMALGIEKGDRVAILSENRPEWAIADFGILSAGAITVPMFSTLTAVQVGYILKDSGAKILCVSTEKQLEKALSIQSDVLEKVILFDLSEAELPSNVLDFKAVCELETDAVPPAVSEEDIATIIYTSGTTGEPKGVMLTHANFIFNLQACKSLVDVDETDVLLSFLPLSHVFERLGGHYVPLFSGAKVAYAESLLTVANNLKEVSPTVMLSVPRLYETMHERILRAVRAGSALRQKIFHWGVGIGTAVSSEIQHGRHPSALLRLKAGIADKLVFSKLKEATGGRLRFFISGGAALPAAIAEFFHAAGILILEGYGLTETSPVISMNHPGGWKFGTVGMPVPGVEVHIAADGEILTRGQHVMKGYFNNPDATAEVIDAEGWFYTGDIGVIDSDGFVKITDRKKNIIVLSNGKNVAPQPIESELGRSAFIEQVLVIGNEQKNLAALIVPNVDAVKEWGAENEVGTDDMQRPEILRLFQAEIRERLKDFADFEQVRRFALLEEEFTLEKNEVTPTLKLKRNVIIERYADVITRMYQDVS